MQSKAVIYAQRALITVCCCWR